MLVSFDTKEYAQHEEEIRFQHQQQLNEEKRRMMNDETHHQNEVGEKETLQTNIH
jgi:hypothetical protein